ncbi:YolD-like family protein [Ectobacillus ponti]|uniref:YolD-like family protein n=1 Tax=Ectobacillus ponti TaxID=2961894 RepID=A0AA41XAM6_9BACI|nr:YolD-like family protein [Ectobacillus ponti]MCP8968536.1 YolD-like family protein [Ectobacillus ponti]
MKPTPQRLTSWDYMWQGADGKRYAGMVLLPWERKKEGRYLWEMKKRIADAYKSKAYVSVTILQGDSFLDLDGRVAHVSEEKSMVTLQDAAGNVHRFRMSDVLHIGDQQEEGGSK